ncbi:hypothetical protein D9M68_849660 [compost metagenome]
MAPRTGIEIGVVAGDLHARHDLELGREVEEFFGDDHVRRQHDGARLVGGLAQLHRIVAQLGAIRDLVPLLQPGQGLGHQWVDEQDFHGGGLVRAGFSDV